MAKPAFTITVEGKYRALVDGRKQSKTYKIENVNLTRQHGEAMLSVVKNLVLPKFGPKLYEDWAGASSWHITKVREYGTDKRPYDPRFMSRPELVSYTEEHHIPITPDLYPTKEELLGAIQRQKTDPEGFVKEQETLEEFNRERLDQTRELDELNEGFGEEPSLPDPEPTLDVEPLPPKKKPGRKKKSEVADDDL